MSGEPFPGPDPIEDPDLEELDRELRDIRFRERASFDPELRARLARISPGPIRGHPAAVAAAVVAAFALGLLQLTASGPLVTDDAAPKITRPVEGVGAVRGISSLYLGVTHTGQVLRFAHDVSPSSVDVVSIPMPRVFFVCAFDARQVFCGEPAQVAREVPGQRTARGPFVYRDLCCTVSRRAGREGVLTVSAVRDRATFVFVYEDVNGDGGLSAGDRLRLRMHPATMPDRASYASRDEPTAAPPLGGPVDRPLALVTY